MALQMETPLLDDLENTQADPDAPVQDVGEHDIEEAVEYSRNGAAVAVGAGGQLEIVEDEKSGGVQPASRPNAPAPAKPAAKKKIIKRNEALHNVLFRKGDNRYIEILKSVAPFVIVMFPFLYRVGIATRAENVPITGCVDEFGSGPVNVSVCVAHLQSTSITVPNVLVSSVELAVYWILVAAFFAISLQLTMFHFYARELRCLRMLPYGIYVSGSRGSAVWYIVGTAFLLAGFSLFQVYAAQASTEIAVIDSSFCDLYFNCYNVQVASKFNFANFATLFFSVFLQYSALVTFLYSRADNPYSSVSLKTLVNTKGHRSGDVAQALTAVKYRVDSKHLRAAVKGVIKVKKKKVHERGCGYYFCGCLEVFWKLFTAVMCNAASCCFGDISCLDMWYELRFEKTDVDIVLAVLLKKKWLTNIVNN